MRPRPPHGRVDPGSRRPCSRPSRAHPVTGPWAGAGRLERSEQKGAEMPMPSRTSPLRVDGRRPASAGGRRARSHQLGTAWWCSRRTGWSPTPRISASASSGPPAPTGSPVVGPRHPAGAHRVPLGSSLYGFGVAAPFVRRSHWPRRRDRLRPVPRSWNGGTPPPTVAVGCGRTGAAWSGAPDGSVAGKWAYGREPIRAGEAGPAPTALPGSRRRPAGLTAGPDDRLKRPAHPAATEPPRERGWSVRRPGRA